MPLMETSALDFLNIEEAFKKLILEIYEATIKTNINTLSNKDNNNSKLHEGKNLNLKINTGENPEKQQKKKCC
jgi:hypothetical protein